MNKFARFASIAAVMAVISACGAKGPLFMPEKAVPIEDAPATPVEEPAAEVPAIDASDATAPVEPPVEVPVEEPATPPADGNG